MSSVSPSHSVNPTARQVARQKRLGFNRSWFLDAARLTTIATLYVAVWMIGAYYPLARFIVLSLLAVATTLVWMDVGWVMPSIRSAMSALLIGLGMLGYGLFQLLRIPSDASFPLSGVANLRESFGELAADVGTYPLTLSPWQTQSWLAMFVIGLSGLMLGAALFSTHKTRLLLLASIAICGAAQVFWAIIQISVHPDQIFWGVQNPGGSTPFGTFLNRNHGADFIGMALFCAIGLTWWLDRESDKQSAYQYESASRWQRAVSSPYVLIASLLVIWLVVGVVLALSRGGWVSTLASLVMLPLCWKRTNRPRRVGWVAVILTVTIASTFMVHAFGFGDRVGNRFNDLELERVISDARWEHWAEALPAAMSFLPFGSGVGTYRYAYLPFEPTPANGWFTYAHNQYLELLTEAGVPGCLLLLAVFVVLGRVTLSLCQSGRSTSKQAMGVAFGGVFFAQALHSLTDFGLMMPGNLLTLSLLSGAAIVASTPSLRISSGRKSRRASSNGDREHGKPVPNPSLSIEKGQKQSRATACAGYAVVVMITVCLAAAIWHQAREVRGDRLRIATRFSPATPSPTVETAGQWIDEIELELIRSPHNEKLLQRAIQLHLHLAQRASYDQIRGGQLAQTRPSDPVSDWDRTSLESIVMQLYRTDDDAPTDIQKQRIRRAMATEPSLAAAWQELRVLLAENPVQPRTHLRLALLGATSGRPWDASFSHSARLSVVDPTLSLGNGLLAWAAGDTEMMTQQWRQNLSVDLTHLELIYRLARLKLTDQAIAERLMPSKWGVPYRLAMALHEEPGTDTLQEMLLDLASTHADAIPGDKLMRQKALAAIARCKGDFKIAAEHYEQAIQSDLKDPNLRYQFAYSLYRVGDYDQAASQARVAMNLAPTNERYKTFFELAKRQHRRSATSR